MEFVSLRTDEEIDTLTIGDRFYSTFSNTTYEIVDLTRSVRSGKITSVKTDTVTYGGFCTAINSYWQIPNFREKFKTMAFHKVVQTKDYDPSQQPYTEDDI